MLKEPAARDRPGPARSGAHPSKSSRTAAMCTGAVWQSRTPDGDDDHPAHARAKLSLRECGRAVPARSAHRHPTANAAAERPGGVGSHANPVYLEPRAKAGRPSGDANPPYVFELGPDHRRRTFDAVQSVPLKKLPVHIEDTIGPLLRPPGDHSTPRTTSGSRAASAAGVAVAACPASLVTAEPRAR